MKHSELVEKYLETNRTRGLGNGYAITSFVNLCCKKRSSRGQSSTYEILRTNLCDSSKCFPFRSYHGSRAYYPADMANEARILRSLAKLQGVEVRTIILARRKNEKRN